MCLIHFQVHHIVLFLIVIKVKRNFRIKYIAVLKQTATMSGFRLFEQSTRPFDEGVIRTYGLRVDS